MHVTCKGTGVPFTPGTDHHGVRPERLHGQEAGTTEQLVVTCSQFVAGASVDPGPVPGETVYVLLAGKLTLEVAGQEATLSVGDSVHLPKGTVRSVRAGGAAATVLVVRAQ